MYKLFPVRTAITVIASLAIFAAFIRAQLQSHFPNHEWPAVTEIVSFVVTVGFAYLWTWAWRVFPILNKWIFPNLTGDWEVEMDSNWSRHVQVLDAALDAGKTFDMRKCDKGDLAPLTRVKLKATIEHTFWTIHMRMWSEVPGAPIRESEIVSIEPFRAKALKKCGLNYIYRQENQTDDVTDDNSFYGAATLEYDLQNDTLSGTFWTQRMWRRAMNTAGVVRMRRVSKTVSKPRRKLKP